MPPPCKGSPSWRLENLYSPVYLIKLIQTREIATRLAGPDSRDRLFYGVAINPLAVATIQRLPQRTIESMRPTPGTVSPRVTVQTPSGPSRIAVPPRTSRTVQPSMVVGLVSGTGSIISRGGIKTVEFAFACTTEAVREDAATTGVPSEPVVAGALRTGPSVLAADFASVPRTGREYVTFCVAGL